MGKITPVTEKLKKSLKSILNSDEAKILLAVSGGSDSTGLMHLFYQFRDDLSLDFEVGFIDHGLRSEVKDELKLLKKNAGKLGIKVFDKKIADKDVNKAKSSGSLQQWARTHRYRLLADIARDIGAKYIATAHTVDDQAETVILRLLRGTGIDGLCAIREKRSINGIKLIRPMLSIRRSEIKDYLQKQKIRWSSDPGNYDLRFERVKVRKQVLPMLVKMQPEVARRFYELANEAANVSDFLTQTLTKLNCVQKLNLNDGVRVKKTAFENIPRGIISRIIRIALLEVRGDLRRIQRVHLEEISEHIFSNNTTNAIAIPGDCVVYVYKGSLYVFPKKLLKITQCSKPASLGKKETCRINFSPLKIKVHLTNTGNNKLENLFVRTRRPGDKLLDSKKRLKQLWTNRDIPRPYRDFFPVLTDGDNIIASPLILPSRIKNLEVKWTFGNKSCLNDLKD